MMYIRTYVRVHSECGIRHIYLWNIFQKKRNVLLMYYSELLTYIVSIISDYVRLLPISYELEPTIFFQQSYRQIIIQQAQVKLIVFSWSTEVNNLFFKTVKSCSYV